MEATSISATSDGRTVLFWHAELREDEKLLMAAVEDILGKTLKYGEYVICELDSRRRGISWPSDISPVALSYSFACSSGAYEHVGYFRLINTRLNWVASPRFIGIVHGDFHQATVDLVDPASLTRDNEISVAVAKALAEMQLDRKPPPGCVPTTAFGQPAGGPKLCWNLYL